VILMTTNAPRLTERQKTFMQFPTVKAIYTSAREGRQQDFLSGIMKLMRRAKEVGIAETRRAQMLRTEHLRDVGDVDNTKTTGSQL
jgi:hypothetical protein